MEVVASLFQGRTAAAQCGLFTHKSVPVIFEPLCMKYGKVNLSVYRPRETLRNPEGKGSRFQDNRHMEVISLSAVRTGHLYFPGNIPGTHFL